MALSVVVVAGCPESPPAGQPATDAESVRASTPDADECAIVLGSIHDAFQLQRLGQTTSVADGVERLNDWQRLCASQLPDFPDFPEPLAGMIAPDVRRSMSNSRFTLRDGNHLRDAIMFRALARHAFAPARRGSELDRVVAGFNFVVRLLELAPRHPQNLPLTPYEIVLLGKGTVEDRAWVLALLLKQLQIDALLITPGGERSDAAPWQLVGVPVEGQVYLFDPQAGVPLPALDPSSDAPVATLAAARENDALLRQLDGTGAAKYPIAAESLLHPTVSLITDQSFWSSRMAALQARLSGDEAMFVFEPLHDETDTPGTWSRVVRAGQGLWETDAMRIWEYPESQLTARLDLNEEQQAYLNAVMSPLEAYLTVVTDPRTGSPALADEERTNDPSAGKFDPEVRVNRRTTRGAQRRARLAQLNGDLATAVQGFIDVWQKSRLVIQVGSAPAIRIPHQRAIDDALFFTALCKFEQQEYKVAVDSLLRYRKQQPQGAWQRQCRLLLAMSYAELGEAASALSELQDVEPDDPEYFGMQDRIRRLKSVSKAGAGSG